MSQEIAAVCERRREGAERPKRARIALLDWLGYGFSINSMR
jgi:hypothetical protein